mmetsp:Transcript_64813/g.142091  ORF Transcript_64813/g.142091 Transcript_64813/m.142091 type:complete len:201 (-) Transcript_64813:261-863(-)
MDPTLRAAPTPALGLGLCLQDFSVRRRSRLGSLGSLGSVQGLEGLHFGWLHFRLSGTLGSGHLRGFQQLHGVIGFYVILGCRFLHLIHLIRLISFIHFLQLFLPRLQLHITGLRRCRCAGRQALSLSSSGRGTLVSGGDGHDAKDLLVELGLLPFRGVQAVQHLSEAALQLLPELLGALQTRLSVLHLELCRFQLGFRHL